MPGDFGGRAAKLGDRFERRWAVRLALHMLLGEASWLRWEPIEEGLTKVDILSRSDQGVRHAYQLKRRSRSRQLWRAVDLGPGLLKDIRSLLSADAFARFFFVSTEGTEHLAELSDRARQDPDNLDVFLATHVGANRQRQQEFETLLGYWGLQAAEHGPRDAFELLQRTHFQTIDERTLSDYNRVLAELLFTGEGDSVTALLGQHLDDHIGETMHPDDLLGLLQRHEHCPRNLSLDKSIAVVVDRANSNFDRSLRARLIGGRLSSRPEAAQLVAKIVGDSPPQLVVCHGTAGSGKSAFMLETLTLLRAAQIVCLPVQLHTHPPEGSAAQFGKSLGLPASPAVSLAALAAGRPSALFLDQLDALRRVDASSDAKWSVCQRVIDEALSAPGMTVVLACRTFDLHHDPCIGEWRRQLPAPRLEVIPLGDFSDETVTATLSTLSVRSKDLSPRVRELLRHPNTLSLWVAAAKDGAPLTDFGTATQLMDRYITARRKDAATTHDVTSESITGCLNGVVTQMETNGALSVSTARLLCDPNALDALASTGLLVRAKDRVSFAHQSIFDHLTAKSALERSGSKPGSVLSWLLPDQSPARRDQLRHLLFLLQDDQPDIAATVMRAILRHQGVRFHLKLVAIGVLAEASPPCEAAVTLLLDLCEDPEWRQHVFSRILWKQPAWFEALQHRGVWSRWLTQERGDRLSQLIHVIGGFSATHPEDIAQLLVQRWRSPAYIDEARASLWRWDPSDDHPDLWAIRLRLVSTRSLEHADMHLHSLALKRPERLAPMLLAIARGAARGERVNSRSKRVMSDVPDGVQDADIWPALRRAGADHVLRALRLVRSLERLIERGTRSQRASGRPPTPLAPSISRQTEAFAIRVAEELIGAAACANESTLHELAPRIEGWRSPACDLAWAKGMRLAPDRYAELAIGWLLGAGDARFDLRGGGGRPWDPAGLLIARFTSHVTDATRSLLIDRILKYHHPYEHGNVTRQLAGMREGSGRLGNELGRAQLDLLRAIPEACRTDQVVRRLAEWEAKFAGQPQGDSTGARRVLHGRGVRRFANERLAAISDSAWLRVLQSSDAAEARIDEASGENMIDKLGIVARSQPCRFAALALRASPDAPIEVFTAVLSAIIESTPPEGALDWRAATATEIATLIAHVGPHPDVDFAMTVCGAVERRNVASWPDSLVEALIAYASHPHPASDGCDDALGNDDSEGMDAVTLTSLNSVRANASRSLQSLLTHTPTLLDRLRPTMLRLLDDPHPAVRRASLGFCELVARNSKDEAFELLMVGSRHPDDRAFGGHGLSRVINTLRDSHNDRLAPLIERMAASEFRPAAKQGAAWATAMHLQSGLHGELVAHCLGGAPPQRRGVADAAADLFQDPACSVQAARMLVRLFDDDDEDVVTEAASVFRDAAVFLVAIAPQLALDFARSRSFPSHAHGMLGALKDSRRDIADFADPILCACERLAEAARDPYSRQPPGITLARREIGALLLRLFERVRSDSTAAGKCLDAWDSMLRAGLTELEEDMPR